MQVSNVIKSSYAIHKTYASYVLSFTVKCDEEGKIRLAALLHNDMHTDDRFSCNTCLTNIHNIFLQIDVWAAHIRTDVMHWCVCDRRY